MLLNRENAEDVVSETFLAAYRAYGCYDPSRASPATWLVRIAHNKAVDFVRSPAHRSAAPLPDELADPASGTFQRQLEDQDLLLYLYARLSWEEREFLDLRYTMELKDAEIAAMYALPVKTVNKRYQRLLRKCRRILEQE